MLANMTNAELSGVFEEIALLLDLQGEPNRFRVRAYERAAQTIGQSRYEIADIYKEGGIKALDELPGIGKEIALKIEELVKTGKLKYIDQLKKKVPPGIFDVLKVEGMGPKRTKFVWAHYGVTSLASLEALARSGELEKEKGWGKKSVEKVLTNLALSKSAAGRLPREVVQPVAERIVKFLLRKNLCSKVEVAGSLRRKQATIGDIDILAVSKNPKNAMDAFCAHPDVATVHGNGKAKASLALKIGIDADLLIVPAQAFGAALQYFTGNKDHNVKLRRLGIRKGVTISEYGVFKGTAKNKGSLVASRTEKDVYAALGLPWIPPEARFDRGEIEAAMKGPKALRQFLEERA